jgi:N-acetylmuramoyl-L-alanine amidase
MKLIKKPSLNHDARPAGCGVDVLLMHYTGMQTGEAAIERLCDSEAKVSAHYVVEEDGRVFQLVEEDRRAWHAGASHWAGRDRINDCSIGIEIINPGHEFGYRPFPQDQMNAVIDLSKEILSRHSIPQSRILGHSDVAPDRKEDPGELFDWQRLAIKGVGRFIDPGSVEPIAGRDLVAGDKGWEVQEFQKNLRDFGYGIEITSVFDDFTSKVSTAFQRHFRPEAINGIADIHCQELLRAYRNFHP